MRTVRTLEDFFEQCSPPERVMIYELMQIIQDCAELQIKISYGVPYFYGNRRVFFLWPASAAFGPKSGLLFGFCQGAMMVDQHGYLDRSERKQLATLTLHSVADVPEQVLREYIQQALMLDQQFSR